MRIIFVRHAESIANLEKRMQGHADYKLSTQGILEAKKLRDRFKKENLEPMINDLIKSHETNFKGVGQPLRIALTGSKFGPGIYDIIISLGKEEVTKRLENKIFS